MNLETTMLNSVFLCSWLSVCLDDESYIINIFFWPKGIKVGNYDFDSKYFASYSIFRGHFMIFLKIIPVFVKFSIYLAVGTLTVVSI